MTNTNILSDAEKIRVVILHRRWAKNSEGLKLYPTMPITELRTFLEPRLENRLSDVSFEKELQTAISWKKLLPDEKWKDYVEGYGPL